jgi:carboxyl-terminal processing protease
VIDIRGNDGGDTPRKLVAALMPRPYRFWLAETPMRVALDLAEGGAPGRLRWPAVQHEPQPGAFAGPVAILQDGGTFSAAEDFVAPFRDNGRARIFGETSAGSSGQPFFQDLGDGLSFRVGAKRQWLADGTEFEGVGIRPDVEVIPTVEDIRLGRDPVLARALAELGA